MKSKLLLVMLSAMALVFLLGSSTMAPVSGVANARKMRWDIVHISSFTPVTANPGGMASARANDGSMITVTGEGTFELGDSEDVTGGGTWATFDSTGHPAGNGTYRVTQLVKFSVAPGTQTNTLVDNIGNGTLTDNRAGLAFLRIAYSDGSGGVLVVSCHLNGNPPPQGPDAAPASVFEGITASKDFVGYWNRVAPAPGVDGNRTLFHVIPDQED